MASEAEEKANQLRCFAHESIIKIMEAEEVSVEDRAQNLHLLWMHAASAHKQVTGEEPKMPEPSTEDPYKGAGFPYEENPSG